MAPVITPRVLLKVRSAAGVGIRHGGAEADVTTVDPCTFLFFRVLSLLCY